MSTKLKRFGPRLTVSLRGTDYERLNALAAQDDVSVSWVIRRAIEDYLRKQPARARRAPAAAAQRGDRRASQTL